MSPPPFPFKAGDLVCLPTWDDGHFIRVTAVGEDAFLGKETDPNRLVEYQREVAFQQDVGFVGWKLYVPPTAVYQVTCYDTQSEAALQSSLAWWNIPNLKVKKL